MNGLSLKWNRLSAQLLAWSGALVFCGWSTLAPVYGEAESSRWTSQQLRVPRSAELDKAPIITALAVSVSSGQIAMAGDDHGIRIWDTSQQRFSATLTGHRDWVRSLAFSPDGSLLASVGNDGRLILWDPDTQQKLQEREQQHALARVAFHPDGKRLAMVGFREPLRLLDVLDGSELGVLASPCEDMRAIAVSPDNRWLAGGGRNGKIRLWDAQTGETVRDLVAHRQRLRALDFSPDGALLASCGDDRTIRVSQADGSDPFVLRVPSAKLMSLSFHGPGRIAVGGSDNLIRIWNLESRAEEARLAGHTGSVTALASAGDWLVSAGYDTTVRIWQHNPNVAGDPRPSPRRVGRRSRPSPTR